MLIIGRVMGRKNLLKHTRNNNLKKSFGGKDTLPIQDNEALGLFWKIS